MYCTVSSWLLISESLKKERHTPVSIIAPVDLSDIVMPYNVSGWLLPERWNNFSDSLDNYVIATTGTRSKYTSGTLSQFLSG